MIVRAASQFVAMSPTPARPLPESGPQDRYEGPAPSPVGTALIGAGVGGVLGSGSVFMVSTLRALHNPLLMGSLHNPALTHLAVTMGVLGAVAGAATGWVLGGAQSA